MAREEVKKGGPTTHRSTGTKSAEGGGEHQNSGRPASFSPFTLHTCNLTWHHGHMCSSLLFMSNTPEIVHYDAFGISYTISSGHQADPLFVQSGCTTTESFLADTSAGNTSHQLTAVENSQPTLSKGISQEMAREEVKKEGPTTTGPSLAVPQVLFWIQGCPCQPCMCFLDRTQDQVCNGSDSILEINASTRGAGPTASEEHALHALMKKGWHHPAATSKLHTSPAVQSAERDFWTEDERKEHHPKEWGHCSGAGHKLCGARTWRVGCWEPPFHLLLYVSRSWCLVKSQRPCWDRSWYPWLPPGTVHRALKARQTPSKMRPLRQSFPRSNTRSCKGSDKFPAHSQMASCTRKVILNASKAVTSQTFCLAFIKYVFKPSTNSIIEFLDVGD